ncbi:unnamed protein product [Ectocarpus sp. 8 AP-2014]
MHLKVDAQIPRRLLAAVDAPPPNAKRLCSTRLPRLRARRVTWNITAAEELGIPIFATTNVDYLKFDCAFEGSLEAVAWPRRLKTIEFHCCSPFNQPVGLVKWPASLHELVFGREFDQRIEHVLWPDSLQALTFGYEFNQPIDRVQWPESLQRLGFMERFNQRIEDVSWPDLLQTFEFGTDFDQPIE